MSCSFDICSTSPDAKHRGIALGLTNFRLYYRNQIERLNKFSLKEDKVDKKWLFLVTGGILLVVILTGTLIGRELLTSQDLFVSEESSTDPFSTSSSEGKGSIFGVVNERGGDVVSSATVRAVSRPSGKVETVASDGTGFYEIFLPEGRYVLAVEKEGFELSIIEEVKVQSRIRQDIELVPKGQANPPFALDDSRGFIFGKGAGNEEEVMVLLAVHGILEKTSVVSIELVELTGDGLSIYYRDGQATAVSVGSFDNEPVWEVWLLDGSHIYVQKKCANIVTPAEEEKVSRPTPTPVVLEWMASPAPAPTLSPTSIPTPALTLTPTSTPSPMPISTPIPTPTPTPSPVPTQSPTLGVSLSAEPNAGYAPLNNVDFFVEVSGTAVGLIEYKLDCTSDGVWEREIITDSPSWHAVDLCDFPNSGEYWVKIRVERGGLVVEGTSTILVIAP